jgi:hypothetical protein
VAQVRVLVVRCHLSPPVSDPARHRTGAERQRHAPTGQA